MHRIKRIGIVTLICVSAVALTAQAQNGDGQADQPQADFAEELAVTEVVLDVLVTDAGGNVVVGLGKDDFIVEDQGQVVGLSGASFYSNRRFMSSAQAADQANIDQNIIPTDRYFVIFFHDDRAANPGLLTRATMDAARYFSKWVREELLPNDHVAVVSFDSQLKVWQDFTQNKSDVEGAIAQVLKGGKDPGTQWASRIPDESGSGPSLRANLPQGKDLRKASRRIYDALRLVAEATESVVGRKNLVLLSWGFGDVSTSYGAYYPDPRYYPNMIQTLNDQNVAVYSIDLISTTRQGSLNDRGINQSLSLLSDDTGGRYYFHFDTFATPLSKVNQENNGYYMLSFSAQYPAGDEGYREVQVRTVNPTFKVRARKGYRYGA
jgi:VWFA-related protein